MARNTSSLPCLQKLDPASPHEFIVPVKTINDGEDVSFWLASKAYTDIMTFLLQLNASMFPHRASSTGKEKEWILHDPDVEIPPVAQSLADLLAALDSIIDEAPPDPGPRRFGNVSFRKWHEIADSKISKLLDRHLSAEVLAFGGSSKVSAKEELQAYLLGSFGSSQRLDYGTGHELSFLAFLGCLWKLGAFPESTNGSQERAIVLGVIEPYLELVRRLILTYTLEPAGSHGVWGLDDHSFLPYIFGSAQFSPAISSPSDIVTEGSLPDAPNPGDVAKANVVQRERKRNMYFSAIGFIYDVKKGPFWEHSPILFDISGVKAGWAKINKGMLKMYNAEVLSKFPVVQHFPMGSLFRWEKDPAAAEVAKSVHTSNQPSKVPGVTARPQPGLRDPLAEPMPMGAQRVEGAMPPPVGTSAPWASSRGIAQVTPAPSGPNQPTRAPWASSTPLPPPTGGSTTAPWAGRGGAAAGPNAAPSTRAPWAERKP